MATNPLLEVQHLSKNFCRMHALRRECITAVDDLNLQINTGEIFAFLGPNGAGKTTTINMLVGFLKPSAGTIRIFGSEFSRASVEIKRRIGYLPEAAHLPTHYRVGELLEFYCELFFIGRKERKRRIDSVLNGVGLEEQHKKLIQELSMGQKRCLGLACALINDPDLLLLDEPTVYLDPLILEKIRTILVQLKKQNKTIFMSSHILSEVEKVCDSFAIIKDGRLLCRGLTRDLKDQRSLEEEFLQAIKKQ